MGYATHHSKYSHTRFQIPFCLCNSLQPVLPTVPAPLLVIFISLFSPNHDSLIFFSDICIKILLQSLEVTSHYWCLVNAYQSEVESSCKDHLPSLLNPTFPQVLLVFRWQDVGLFCWPCILGLFLASS